MSPTIKKYVGAAGDALAYMWQKLRGAEEEPPLGSKNKAVKPKAAGEIGGIGAGTILLIAILWFAMKGRRGG